MERAATFRLILDDITLDTSDLRKGVHRSGGSQTDGSAGSRESQTLETAAIVSAEGDVKAAELIASSLATAGDRLIELHELEASEDITYQLSLRTSPTCPLGSRCSSSCPSEAHTSWGHLDHSPDDSQHHLPSSTPEITVKLHDWRKVKEIKYS
eukprot:bmy_21702T0